MAQQHEWMFYELMWRAHTQDAEYPLPWWVQMYFRRWTDAFDGGLFDSKEGSFASNGSYRYWNMIGVKDHHQESLVGQCGEIEPVYDKYCLSFFLFDPAAKKLWFPQHPDSGRLRQNFKDNYLPVLETSWESNDGVYVKQSVSAHVVGDDQKSMVLSHFQISRKGGPRGKLWFCLAVLPFGPTGFQRHDRAGRGQIDKLLSHLEFQNSSQVKINQNTFGPVFQTPPEHFGLYGNGSTWDDPNHYLVHGPFYDLKNNGALNSANIATDYIAGLCTGVFAWEMNLAAGGSVTYEFDVRLPVDNFLSSSDFNALQTASRSVLQQENESFWRNKLDQDGLQVSMTPLVTHLCDLHRICRANILILSDDGQIHPGPTIYDDFWIRDSSIEGIAAALAGDKNLAHRQYSQHYPNKFNLQDDRIGPCSTYGFFGGEHEKNDQEWDSNGQVLWAIGKFDRIQSNTFGAGMFYPYIVKGARWLRDNRSAYGLLHSGWSAEHIGDKDKPHYWDDFWAIAGLYEAARLAERINAPEKNELWSIYDSLKTATADSIRWVLGEQRRQGEWRTYIPTGPGDVKRDDSTMVGTLAYFHPCRLYMGSKLGSDIDYAARMTLETIWYSFVRNGGFYHESAWNCFGPYLTLQLAHAFLLIGDTDRMDACLQWTVGKAGYAKVTRSFSNGEMYDVVHGAWNEQHCLSIETDFRSFPAREWWYMGDIPHGWACAEFIMLMRDILFFEADEDHDSKIFIAPGVMPHWLESGSRTITVRQAPTIFGGTFGYTMTHAPEVKSVCITIDEVPMQPVGYVYRCPFGSRVTDTATEEGKQPVVIDGLHVYLPPGTPQVSVSYE